MTGHVTRRPLPGQRGPRDQAAAAGPGRRAASRGLGGGRGCRCNGAQRRRLGGNERPRRARRGYYRGLAAPRGHRMRRAAGAGRCWSIPALGPLAVAVDPAGVDQPVRLVHLPQDVVADLPLVLSCIVEGPVDGRAG